MEAGQPSAGIKRQRDSFVHCAPGPDANKFGIVKESAFHEIHKENVGEAVTLTCQLIRDIWHLVKKRDGPTWLRKLPAVTEEQQGLQLTTPTAVR
jgi:hypothetical protein